MIDKNEVEMPALLPSLGVQGQVETLRLLPSVHVPSEHQEGEGGKMKCECGCGRAVREGNRFICGHFWRGKHLTDGARKKLSEGEKGNKNHMWGAHHSIETRSRISETRKGQHPTKESRRKMSESHKGERNHNYGKHFSEATRKKLSKSRENLSAETLRKMSEVQKGKHHTKEVRKKMSKARKVFATKYPDRARENSMKGGLASISTHRKNAPYWFADVPFASDDEGRAMMILCEKFDITPIEGVNCHVRVNGGEIDFRPKLELFVEYHPWDRRGLTHGQYYNRRRRLLDENGFQDCRLIVAKSLDEVRAISRSFPGEKKRRLMDASKGL